jgi:glycosyltransferase involved in cell wall biosynthesis
MTISFFSNCINHHQIPLSESFLKQIGSGYTFIATSPLPDEQRILGYRDENKSHPYILITYDNANNERLAMQLANDSDVVIIGSADEKYIIDRLKDNKITFHYGERLFKKGLNLKTFPRYFLSSMKHIRRFQQYPLYWLCASAYTASDIQQFADYTGRMYKWAYFTETKKYSKDELYNINRQNRKPVLLWVGRLIHWKHPDHAIKAAAILKSKGYSFELRIIGIGDCEAELRRLVDDLGLTDTVFFLGSMSPDKVREQMLNADIFITTSDYNEGWGAVLNEAMSVGCAVVASHAAGSTPFLIRNRVNGFQYKFNDIGEMSSIITELVQSKNLCEEIGYQAYLTMQNTWNASVAADRFIQLYNAIKQNAETPFTEGPCSPALPIKQRNMYESCLSRNI